MGSLLELKKEDFENLPIIGWQEAEGKLCNSLIIVPTGEMHDSKWQMMSFCLVDLNNNPIALLDSGTDIIHFDGIGSYGKNGWKWNLKNNKSPRSSWQIDCLPCGYLRIFSAGGILIGSALSSLQIYGSAEDVL